jgi:hypothetical protein
MAWLRGLKTTYYLRALGATSAEKSTITGALNAVKPASVEAPSLRQWLKIRNQKLKLKKMVSLQQLQYQWHVQSTIQTVKLVSN